MELQMIYFGTKYSIVPPLSEMDHQKDHQLFIVIKKPQTEYMYYLRTYIEQRIIS